MDGMGRDFRNFIDPGYSRRIPLKTPPLSQGGSCDVAEETQGLLGLERFEIHNVAVRIVLTPPKTGMQPENDGFELNRNLLSLVKQEDSRGLLHSYS